MKVSVIIPFFNEEKYLRRILERVMERPEVLDVIAVDDGSTDGSAKIVDEFANKYCNIKVIHLKQNRGKGTAITNGLKYVNGEIVLIQDADLEYDPADYPTLIEPFRDPRVQVVYGSRLLKKGNPISYLHCAIGGILLTLVTNILYGANITDESTGYKVFKTSLLRSIKLTSKGFEFCPEVTAKILKKGIKIHEVPISYRPRKVSEGKKIKFRDGVIAIWTLLKYKLT